MSKPSLFWWDPRRSLKDFSSEMFNHSRSWRSLYLESGRFQNFGDAFSPLAFELASGSLPRWAPARTADFLGIGSILSGHTVEKTNSFIWGSGIRNPMTVSSATNHERFLSVRGTMTNEHLGNPARILGEPGLLVYLLGLSRQLAKPNGLYIPHFTELNTTVGRKRLSRLRSVDLEIQLPTDHPIDVARRILTSRYVLTSSLHGLVFAYALGVPAYLSLDAVGESEFKYKDFLTLFEESISPLSDLQIFDQTWGLKSSSFRAEQEHRASLRVIKTHEISSQLVKSLKSTL